MAAATTITLPTDSLQLLGLATHTRTSLTGMMVRPLAVSEFFTWHAFADALTGGILLGAAVAFKMGVLGQVLGISGTTRGLLSTPSLGRLLFILGLIIAGLVMSAAFGAVEPMPPPSCSSLPLLRLRMAGGGFLVGLGTAFGNGCTSGHGLTGLARLSRRSWVAVPCFMSAGIATATLTGTAAALPPDPTSEEHLREWFVGASCAIGLAALLLLCALWTRLLARTVGHKLPNVVAGAKLAAELFAGLLFGCGLVFSSMARPSKVASFLDLGSGSWDPSLAFVMGGALLVTFPFYQILRRVAPEAPVLGGAFSMPPTSAAVDVSLVAGSLTFGIGWGICGVCPGPIWVLLGARPSAEVAIVLVCMLLGLGVWVMFDKVKKRRATRVAPILPELSGPALQVQPGKTPMDMYNCGDREGVAVCCVQAS